MGTRFLTGLAAGTLFGLGLAVSDMINPARVLAFLDIAGAWDPTLAFVMGGALLPMAVAWRMVGRPGAQAPAVPSPSEPPDAKLVAGAAVFGLGWGLVGLCPGPAIALIGVMLAGDMSLYLDLAVFLAAMALGMMLHGRIAARAAIGRRSGGPTPRPAPGVHSARAAKPLNYNGN